MGGNLETTVVKCEANMTTTSLKLIGKKKKHLIDFALPICISLKKYDKIKFISNSLTGNERIFNHNYYAAAFIYRNKEHIATLYAGDMNALACRRERESRI